MMEINKISDMFLLPSICVLLLIPVMSLTVSLVYITFDYTDIVARFSVSRIHGDTVELCLKKLMVM